MLGQAREKFSSARLGELSPLFGGICDPLSQQIFFSIISDIRHCFRIFRFLDFSTGCGKRDHLFETSGHTLEIFGHMYIE